MNTGLRAGATIITMPRFEPGQFLDLLERYAVTRGHAVPPMALAPRHPAVAGRDLSALRHITCGAAPLGAELVVLAFVAGQVAPYKRIRVLACVPEIPKSPSGKIPGACSALLGL